MSSFDCCKKGSFHKGTPKGQEIQLGNLPAYVSGPEDSKAAILVICDIFGWRLNNIRVLADKYAEGVGARVYVPDFFDGEAAPADILGDEAKRAAWNLADFLSRHHPREAARPLVDHALSEIKGRKHAKVGTIGFCWGAPSVLYLGSDLAPIQADAIAFAHPSVVEVSDFEKIRVAATFLTCEVDQQLPEEKRLACIKATEKLVSEGGDRDGKLFIKWVYYPKVVHGFATRGDEGDEFTAKSMADACNQAILFFRSELL
ncbi:hypothetical protein IE53DRAFT_385987 [Violaceomyces palustris]|uniref:Uncharacterized protein n=1 Tax=Violaceomyces palustris TaxID=1673888 RepID=A0ACD0P0K9_9BASI|nr:hypothetical protein IE53DRAFT_385987 [Violaceomyces palustris]